jgi:2-methylaconitate cis-trans-isomerase PrpF
MQKRIPTVYMRGGTSKGLFFHEHDLPQDPEIRERVILAAYGSPDPNCRQIDGVGGAVSTTSKVAIISKSKDPGYDVVYQFGQVSIDKPMVEYQGNCGNMSAAVGPFAVDENMVRADEPVTRVRIFQKNTNKLIVADVPVKQGCHDEDGECFIDGIPCAGSSITLRFFNPGGSLTGRLFPTGNLKDTFEIAGVGSVDLTIIDAANPVVLISAKEIGLTGIEIEEVDQNDVIRNKLEAIRSTAAVRLGFTASTEEATAQSRSVPKVAFVAPAQSYTDLCSRLVRKEQIDLVARIMSMGTLHKAYAVSGAIATVGAALIEGTVVNEMLHPDDTHKEIFRIGHPGGIIEVGAKINRQDNTYEYMEAFVIRTARRLMEGHVLVPEKYFYKKE